MTAEELIGFRVSRGWSQEKLARALRISPSRVVDYEVGFTRGKRRRPAPIPFVVELACAELARRHAAVPPEAVDRRLRAR
jgi:hypothetical protein